MSRIIYSKDSYKSLSSYEKKITDRIINAINDIPLGDIKRIQGNNMPPLYRLRVGKFRVVYSIIEDRNIKIIKIDTRGDIYK